MHWVGTIEESFATGDVETDGRAGSLVGRVSQLQASGTATISNSYATGSVTSREDTAGGIVGSLHNGYELEIDNSFATGQISGRDTGGLVGEIGSGGDVDLEDSYWDNKTTGQSAAVGDGSADTTTNVEGLTTSQMAGNDADKNMELDFKEIWRTVSGSYPKFQWES
ncbi:GLUG motif-containing protein [Halovenus salina]|uniref:GLUG motif-containing protein n=1 Tax=Halovenus salina TaxID=1510225 RepID=A0ABD5W3G0_9EURY